MSTKERPILFSGPLVRAILAGRKTETRRIAKLPLPLVEGAPLKWLWLEKKQLFEPVGSVGHIDTKLKWGVKSPYGMPGDRLWVRETIQAVEQKNGLDGVRYAADGHFQPIENTREAAEKWSVIYDYGVGEKGRKIPSIHMPKWASRITLEITSVGIERLHDMTESEAIDEGAPIKPNPDYDPEDPCDDLEESHFAGFYFLWIEINGRESWESNPWVWVVKFKRLAVTS